MSSRFRYSRWDGTQNLDDLDPDDVLDALSDDLMSYGDLNAALQRLYRWGAGDMPGLEQLLQQLQQQMLDQMFKGLKQSIQSMTREDLGLVREMVRDLNRMLEQRRQGLDTSASFRDFMQKYGQMFPPGIETLDQLLEHLQRQMAQMQSLMQSLSPQARDELRRMMDELLQDDSLRLELARLGAMMQQLMPPSELTERYPFFGGAPPS